MSQQEIQELELTIEAAREIVERGNMATRLADNPDFKKIIMEGFFRDEAARLVHLVSDPSLPEGDRSHIQNAIQGIGYLKRYLSTMVQMGVNAEREINESRETLEEIRSEELYESATTFEDSNEE